MGRFITHLVKMAAAWLLEMPAKPDSINESFG